MRAARLLHAFVSACELPALSGKGTTASQLWLIARRINIKADIRPAELRGKPYPGAILAVLPRSQRRQGRAGRLEQVLIGLRELTHHSGRSRRC